MNGECNGRRLVLASKSPRRRYLLEKAGLCFDVVPSRVDEGMFQLGQPEVTVRELAEAKTLEVAARCPQRWVIGADTIVVIDGVILGKPASADDAGKMLARLSARAHRVLTAYCVCCRSMERHFCEVVATKVHFKFLSKGEIDWYIRTGEPFGKAGAYAIQGIGAFLVKSISGSYTNVVGLPVCEVIQHLITQGVVAYDGDNSPALHPMGEDEC